MSPGRKGGDNPTPNLAEIHWMWFSIWKVFWQAELPKMLIAYMWRLSLLLGLWSQKWDTIIIEWVSIFIVLPLPFKMTWVSRLLIQNIVLPKSVSADVFLRLPAFLRANNRRGRDYVKKKKCKEAVDGDPERRYSRLFRKGKERWDSVLVKYLEDKRRHHSSRWFFLSFMFKWLKK